MAKKLAGKASPKPTNGRQSVKKEPQGRSSIAREKKEAIAGKVGRRGQPTAVVGIGASAGGLEAIEKFFEAMPPETGVAFVVVQHLSPDYKSIMGTLLAKYTGMHISEVRSGVRLEADRIYLNPPHMEVTLNNGRFNLEKPVVTRGIRLPIDHFFSSLATDQRERAIAVVVSGTGSDGTVGIKAIKCAGGMVMVQEEKQAKYDSMPHAAIGTGLVDHVLPVEKMAAQLLSYSRHPYIERTAKDQVNPQTHELHQKVFGMIRQQTGHDLSGYKLNTISRRIERRMAVHQITGFPDYVRYMEQHREEVLALFQDLLISVTSFFRDPEAWDVLEKKILPSLLAKKPLDGTVRVWVPGCATGEEAYSLAMLLVEMTEKKHRRCTIQVFATDIDVEAITKARAGVYSASITAEVSPERLKKFFVKNDRGYKIKKDIRDMVVFAVQDVLKDAPFSKLDIVSCRNVMIYMGAGLQKKLLPLFHYILNPGGVLFLGTSETIGASAGNFMAISPKWRIYERRGGSSRGPGYLPGPVQISEGRAANVRPAAGPSHTQQLAERMILQEYSLPCVLIDEKSDIQYFSGDTSRYLSQPAGEPTFNILELARNELRGVLNIVMHKARQARKTVTSREIPLRFNDDISSLKLMVRPIASTPGTGPMLLVVFKEKLPHKPKGGSTKKTERKHTSVIEQELRSTKEYLQTTIEELETSNEELKSTNEEMQSTNEELQSTNEELETSREELQSMNEELGTVNSELQTKMDELSHVNNDLSNLISSTEVATIFLDNDLRIKRFTPTMKELFKVIDTDSGRPIGDIVHNLRHDELLADAEQVVLTLKRVEKEIESKDGRWFIMKILPYRTAENAIDGVVMTFAEITPQKKTELAAMLAQSYAESVVETVREPLVVLDDALKVISANVAFYELCGTLEANTIGKRLYELGEGQWNVPTLRKALEKVLPKDKRFTDLEVTCEFAKGVQRSLVLNGRQVHSGGIGTEKILLAMEEVASD